MKCQRKKCFLLPFIALALSTLASWPSTLVRDSLSKAIREANPGDTLILEGPDIFRERVIIDKPLRLVGSNSPVIDAAGSGTAITVQAPHVELVGLIVTNGGTDLGAFDSGIMLQGEAAVVRSCRVEGGGFGIYIRGVNNCRVEQNSVFGNTNVPASKRGNGIHLWKTKHNTVSANYITGTRDGAYFSYADENLILSNRIEQTRFGIHYMYSHRNQLLYNTLTWNAVGAALMFARDCRVEGNRAFANRRHGILLKQVESSLFLHNAVYGQNRGFFVQQAVKDRFEENAIAENDIGLYLSNGSEQNVFIGNAFIANADQVWQPQDEVERGRQASNAFSENGRGNFWSDYTGSDAAGDGVGDTPYHETTLYGFMVDRYPEARVFALSPAAALLRKGEELLPVLDTEGVTDLFPLQQPGTRVLALMPAPTELCHK